MPTLNYIRTNSTWRDIIEGQFQHLAFAGLMMAGALSLLENPPDAPKLFGLTSYHWAVTSIFLAVIHQIIVAFVFRMQLYCNMMTRLFGRNDMKVWAALFMPLLAIRPLSTIITGWADTTPISGVRIAEIIPCIFLILIALWAMHSVLYYFTLPRALGGDHFRDSYAQMPLVRIGAFKYTDNAMYGLVFLAFWGIALLFGSWNALVVALFQHAYIWVHMYCTEAPDMARIYNKSADI